MECSLQDKIRNGINNSVKSTIEQTALFNYNTASNLYIPIYTNLTQAKQKVQEINRSYRSEVLKEIDNGYRIQIQPDIVKTYELLGSSETSNVIKLMKQYGIYEQRDPNEINADTLFSAIHEPEISEFTYEKLVKFLTSINPNLKIEELDSLSEDAISFIKEFVIGIRTGQRLKAMPEEVGHFFIELLPDESELKKEMLSNITNFDIYSDTFKKYNKIYVRDDGRPDIEKIKKEAAGKLIGIYITAISNNDATLVNKLVKVKESWLRKWLRKLLEFFNLNIISQPDYKSYYQAANEILSPEISEKYKSDAIERLKSESFTSSYFYRLLDEEYSKRYYDYATKIQQKGEKTGNLSEIIDSVEKLRRTFNNSFKKILNEKEYDELNKALFPKKNGITTSNVNILVTLNRKLAGASLKLQDYTNVNHTISGLQSFLEVIDKLDILSNALYEIVSNKEKVETFDEAINNINELQRYTKLYYFIKNVLDNEITEELQTSGVGKEIIDIIKESSAKFQSVTDHILSKQRQYFKPIFSHLLAFTRDKIGIDLKQEYDEAVRNGDPKEIIDGINEKIEKFVQTDEKINKFLLGLGDDLDLLQQLGYWTNAAISNGDIYVSRIAKFIQDKIYENQGKYILEQRALNAEIAELENQGLSGEAFRIGEKITRVSKKFDPIAEKGNTMEVVTFLGPVKYNEYYIKEKEKRDLVNEKLKNYNESRTREAREEWKNAKNDLDNFILGFRFNKYKREYYQVFENFSKNPLFIEQYNEWQIYTEEISSLRYSQQGATFSDSKDIEDKIAQARKLQSTLLSNNDIDGIPKTEEELEKARLLKQYFEESAKFREYDAEESKIQYNIAKESYNLELSELLNSLKGYKIGEVEKILRNSNLRINYIFSSNIDAAMNDDDIEEAVDIIMQKWENANTKIVIKQSYWDKKKEMRQEIDKLKTELGAEGEDVIEKYNRMADILMGTRDGIGQVNPEVLTEDERREFIELETELLGKRKEIYLALYSEEEILKIESLQEQLEKATTRIQQSRIRNDIRRIEKRHLNNPKVQLLKSYYKDLGEMKTMQPTEYYWDKMSDFSNAISEYRIEIGKLADETNDEDLKKLQEILREFQYSLNVHIVNRDFDEIVNEFFVPEGDNDNAAAMSIILNGEGEIPSLQEALSKAGKKQEFSDAVDWFKSNHISGKKIAKETRSEGRVYIDKKRTTFVTLSYYPSRIYLQEIPTDLEYLDEEVSKKFAVRKVKDEFYTGYNPKTKKIELQVGYHVDNRGKFLPLPKEENPQTNEFIDEEYYKLKESNSVEFRYLETLKAAYLKSQNLVDESLRRYLDVPVRSLSSVEEKMRLGTTIKEKANEIASLFGKKEESTELTEQEAGYANIKQYDGFTGELLTEVLPRLGMGQRIEPKFVSRDMHKSVLAYMEIAQDFAARSERLPVMQALINTFKTGQKGKGNKNRAEVFEKLYEKDILKTVPETLVNNQVIRTGSRILTSGAALRLMFNPIGGAVNYIGASINNLTEAFAGRYVNMREYTMGSMDAGKMMMAIVADYSKKSDLSYWTLLYQTFDFVQGDFSDDILDRTSVLDKVTQFRQLSMLPMKAGELKAQSSMALGILYRRKAKDINGKEYPFHQIYEKKGNDLVLKEGFDQEKYNPINGTEFLKTKQIIHKINLELHGNYAKINSTELSRYSIGKLAENLKKWFIPALQRRFGREGIDVVTEEMDGGGYLRTALNFLWGMIRHFVKGDIKGAQGYYRYYTKTERYKRNLLRASFDVAMTGLLFVVFGLLLGYTGDDKNEKLKQNSRLHNLAILIFLRAYFEHTSYYPFPPFGYQELKKNLLSPFSLQADTVSNWFGVGQLLSYHLFYAFGWDSLEKDLFYQRDSGYAFTEKGDAKIWKYIFKSFGYSGYTYEPEQFIKDLNSIQGRLK